MEFPTQHFKYKKRKQFKLLRDVTFSHLLRTRPSDVYNFFEGIVFVFFLIASIMLKRNTFNVNLIESYLFSSVLIHSLTHNQLTAHITEAATLTFYMKTTRTE